MAGLYSSSTIETVRAASDIVDVIGAVLPLKRAGSNFVALCPFHREKSPSFNVNPQRQIFHCFGCHKGGDVFTFIREYENLSFVEAVRRLAERANIPLETEPEAPGQRQARHVKETLLTIHEEITKRWHGALLNEASGQVAREYLARRGVSEEAVKLFRLGCAPEAWDDTVNWAKSKGYDLAMMEQAGLVVRKEGSDHHYDRFRGRLIFPICDEQGRVVAFSGRILAGDEKVAKYVNSPETPIFTKGRVFFGLDKSKRPMLDAQSAVVCEGQLDLIAMYMSGVKNVVAPQGTALTGDHARILKRYVEEVVLCFDSDTAGQSAAVRSLDSLLASGLAIRVATVPAPHDPDSFIKERGGETFAGLIRDAEGFFDFYLALLQKTNDVSTDKGKLAVVQRMGEAVTKTRNLVLLDNYAQKTALHLGVAPESVRLEFQKVSRGLRAFDEADEEAPDEAAESKPTPQESWLVKLLLTHEEIVQFAGRSLNPEWVQHPVARQTVELILGAHANGSWRGVAALLNETPSAGARSMITEIITEDREVPNPEKQLAEVLVRIRNQWIDRQLAQLAARTGQPDLSDSERLEILQRQQQLRVLKRSPLVERAEV